MLARGLVQIVIRAEAMVIMIMLERVIIHRLPNITDVLIARTDFIHSIAKMMMESTVVLFVGNGVFTVVLLSYST